MKYLSEWDQWKRYSSKSWKRFIEKAREMTTHLELWREDIRSIEGTTLHALQKPPVPGGKGHFHLHQPSAELAFPSMINTNNTAARISGTWVFVTRKITDSLLPPSKCRYLRKPFLLITTLKLQPLLDLPLDLVI